MSEISLTGDQMLTVLLAVARRGPVTSAEVARQLQMNRTVAYRLLTTLERRGFVTKDESRYTLGPVAHQLAGTGSDLAELAGPFLRAFSARTSESVVVHKIVGQEAVVIAEASGSQHQIRVHQDIGEHHPVVLGANGRVLLAFSKPTVRDRIIGSAERPVALKKSLREVREQGYAVSHDELRSGVHGLAVPILDTEAHALASVAVVVPTVRSATLMAYLDDLGSTASRIARSYLASNG